MAVVHDGERRQSIDFKRKPIHARGTAHQPASGNPVRGPRDAGLINRASAWPVRLSSVIFRPVVQNEDSLRPSSRELGAQAIRRAGTRNATRNEASGQKPQPSSRAALLLRTGGITIFSRLQVRRSTPSQLRNASSLFMQMRISRRRSLSQPIAIELAESPGLALTKACSTSAGVTVRAGEPIALALLRGGRSHIGSEVTVYDAGAPAGRASVVSFPFYDPSGERMNA